MRKKLAVLLVVSLIPMSGAVACGQAIEDRARDEVNKQVEKGKQRVDEEVQKGKKQLQEEAGKVQKQAEQVGQDAKKAAGNGQ